MNSRKQRIEAVFDALVALPSPQQREIYLGKACAEDPQLRLEVEELLQAHERAGGFLVATVSEVDTLPLKPIEAAPSEHSGAVIGRYKLLEKIGEGGMGVVYMAEQREPVVRKVALKIIKLGMDTRSVVARFEAERQALALMDHPNIAKVLDAGATDSGRPYFVMDLVQGLPIVQFCDEAKLSTGGRIELFLEVCSAIQHAHQKGIIHRDIKPSNILVTLHGDKPVPKVIDFGIAKATQGRLTDKTLFTQFQQFIGTPAYMSPEQASLSGLDIDTRSDIYALGVLLYELLTGKTPFDATELMKAGVDEMRRTIREQEPQRPSTRLRSLAGEELTTTAKRRGMESPRLINALKGDVDWIVMKCLEKDRARRYETANDLAADLRRHVSNEPVVARPPSAVYRFEKLICRHRTASVAVAAVMLAVLLGAVVSTASLLRERAARARAEAQGRLAQKRLDSSLSFVTNLFSELYLKMGDLIGASEAMDSLGRTGLTFVNSLSADDDNDDPKFRRTLAKLYHYVAWSQGNPFAANSISDYESALISAHKSLDILKSLPRSSPPELNDLRWLVYVEDGVGSILFQLRRDDLALAHYQQALAIAKEVRLRYPQSVLVDQAHFRIGNVLFRQGKIGEALTNYYLPVAQKFFDIKIDEGNCTAFELMKLHVAHEHLGKCRQALGDPNAALFHLSESLRLTRVLTERFPNNARSARDLPESEMMVGQTLLSLGRTRDALSRLDDGLKHIEALYQRDPANGESKRMLIDLLHQYAKGYGTAALEGGLSPDDRRARQKIAVSSLVRCLELRASPAFQGLKSTLEQTDADLARELRDLQAALAK